MKKQWIALVALAASASAGAWAQQAPASAPVQAISGRTVVSLEKGIPYTVTIEQNGKQPIEKEPGWAGADQGTGAIFNLALSADRPDKRPCIVVHPPYRGGVGTVQGDARFALPNIQPITLSFATALRDSSEKEGSSDGVEWKVLVAPEGGEFQQVFQRFSMAKQWEPAEVDLSAFAGKTVTLRLWVGPGPAKNTSCDQGYLGAPVLTVGTVTQAEKDALKSNLALKPGLFFADTTATGKLPARAPVATRVLGARYLGNGRVECDAEVVVFEAQPGFAPFIHLSHEKGEGREKIAFHGFHSLPKNVLETPGAYPCKIRFTVPAQKFDGELRLRYGFYTAKGARLMPMAYLEDTRVRGGVFRVTLKADGAVDNVTYTPEVPPMKMVSFGPVGGSLPFVLQTDGAEWKVAPVAAASALQAELNLSALGAAGKRVVAVEACDVNGNSLGAEKFTAQGEVVRLNLSGKGVTYRVKLQ